MSIGVSEYLDKIYKNKKVIHTYKIHDEKGNKLFWKEWGKRIKRDMNDIDYEYFN